MIGREQKEGVMAAAYEFNRFPDEDRRLELARAVDRAAPKPPPSAPKKSKKKDKPAEE